VVVAVVRVVGCGSSFEVWVMAESVSWDYERVGRCWLPGSFGGTGGLLLVLGFEI
jgi:hypothetical protein